MGIVLDLFKEIPLSGVLKEKLTELEAKYAALDTENAILKEAVLSPIRRVKDRGPRFPTPMPFYP